jgi:hypothetical protein
MRLPVLLERAPVTVDLDRLELLAAEATPGPWCWMATGEKDNSWSLGTAVWPDDSPVKAADGELGEQENERWNEETGEGETATRVDLIAEHFGVQNTFSDAAFIAACDPEIVLALVRIARAALAVDAADETDEIMQRLADLSAELAPFRGPVAAAEDAG